MHILIGLITALAGLMWALNALQRSGFSFSSINPYYWYRRYQWRKKYGQNPLYTLESPMEAAAALLLGTAKLEGEISREQKSTILSIFVDEFHLSADDAANLFASTAYLLQSETNFIRSVGKVLEPSLRRFDEEKARSLVELMTRVAGLDSEISVDQRTVIDSAEKIFMEIYSSREKWS